MKRGPVYAMAITFALFFMIRPSLAKVDDPAEPLAGLEWIKGGPIDIRQNVGEKVYLVEFWATWCPPCIESAPHLTKLQKEFKDAGLVVVGITDEESDYVRHFLKEHGERMEYAIAVDAEYQTSEKYLDKYQISSIPTAFVINRRGNIVWHGSPFDPAMEASLQEALKDDPKAKAADGSETKSDARAAK